MIVSVRRMGHTTAEIMGIFCIVQSKNHKIPIKKTLLSAADHMYIILVKKSIYMEVSVLTGGLTSLPHLMREISDEYPSGQFSVGSRIYGISPIPAPDLGF